MICLICKQDEPRAGLARVTFLGDEFNMVVKDVPALVCPVCGEAYTDEATVEHLLEIARETRAAGLQAEIRLFI